MIGAAVDVGSNSVHLLVARPAPVDGGLEHVAEKSEFLGLGDGVDQTGELSVESVGQLVAALGRLRELAVQAGADWLELVGTAPLRRATNGGAVAAEVERRLGLSLRILSEDEEGALTFAGVVGPAGPPPVALLVVDIGGGSSEVISHRPGRPLAVTSLPTGSASLTARLVEHDPPTKEDIRRLRRRAAELVEGLPDYAPGRAVFCGGTPTKLARFGRLDRPTFERVLRVARSMPAGMIANHLGLNLRRAQQLAAGAALVEALLDRYRLAAADTSEASLRDGLILARLGSAGASEPVGPPQLQAVPALASEADAPGNGH